MLLCYLEDNVDENGEEVVRLELKENGNLVEQAGIARSEGVRSSHSSSQNAKSDHKQLVTSMKESKDIPNDTESSDTISNSTKLSNRKTIKSRSSAHIGAGDSVQQIDIADGFNIKKINESGDAQSYEESHVVQ